MNTPPRNDAAPLAGGAGVNGPNTSPDSTFARLPLMPPVRNDAPETSRVAAGRIAAHAGTLRAAVLSMLRERGEHGATDQEIQDALQLPSNSCPATVWVLSEFAPKPEGGAA